MGHLKRIHSSDRDEERMLECFVRAKAILDKAGIRFWLDWGTLLGAVRDGKFIPWDHDIDLAMWSEFRKKRDACVAEFVKDGWKVYAHHPGTLKIRLNGQPPAGLDLYCYEESNEEAGRVGMGLIGSAICYWASVVASPWIFEADLAASSIPKGILKIVLIKGSRMLFYPLRKGLAAILRFLCTELVPKRISEPAPSRFFKEFKTIDFYGMDVNIPVDVESYLSFRYGEDWRTPKRYWGT